MITIEFNPVDIDKHSYQLGIAAYLAGLSRAQFLRDLEDKDYCLLSQYIAIIAYKSCLEAEKKIENDDLEKDNSKEDQDPDQTPKPVSHQVAKHQDLNTQPYIIHCERGNAIYEYLKRRRKDSEFEADLISYIRSWSEDLADTYMTISSELGLKLSEYWPIGHYSSNRIKALAMILGLPLDRGSNEEW